METESCFVCQPEPARYFTEWLYQWLECRSACQQHIPQAQLESGELLTSFMDRYESDNGWKNCRQV